jgi:lysophospholipase L1-like esterase
LTRNPTENKLKNFLFSIFLVFIFFGLLEAILRLSGFQPTLPYKKFDIPAWMVELDPLVLAKYQSFIVDQNFVNEDAYAYKPDLRYGYLLKPNLQLTVSNYSSAVYLDKLPRWTIASDLNGNRIALKYSENEYLGVANRTLHILGDSSSFGWGVNFEDSYPQKLKEKLKQFSKIIIKNYSTPGFTSYQGRLLLGDKVKVKKGDIVLVSFGANDSYSAIKSDRIHFQARNSFIGKMNFSLSQLNIYKWLRTILYYLPESTISETKNRRVSLEEYQENLKVIFKSTLSDGGVPIFVNICNSGAYGSAAEKTANSLHIPFYNFPENFKPYLSKIHDLYPEKFVSYFEAYGKIIEKETRLVFLFPDLCHPNYIGHELMADILSLDDKFPR